MVDFFNKYPLSIYFVPDTVVDSKYTKINKMGF